MKTYNFDSLSIDIELKELLGVKIEIIHFRGRIGNQNSYQVAEEMMTHLDSSIPNIIIGLKQLEYINSQGLAFLLSLIRRVEGLNGRFIIGGVNQMIETIIQLVEVSDQVVIVSSIDDALSLWK